MVLEPYNLPVMLVPVLVKERLYIPRAPEFEDMLSELRSEFSYPNPEFHKKKAMNKWTGNTPSQIKTWSHVEHEEWDACLTLPRGGTNKVRKVLGSYGLTPRFIDQRLSLPPISNLYNDVTLRPDQKRLAEAMYRRENCLIRSPTASGKTETALKVTEWILKTAGPVIVVVWESELLQQWVERIMLRFGLRERDVGILGGGKKRIAPITVAMQQTLMKQGPKYAHSFGGLIADEVQRFAAPTFQTVIDIFSARYRIGISADETRRDGKQFLIYDAFGTVADEIGKAQLIDEGKIHNVTVRLVPTQFDYEVKLNNEYVPWVRIPPDLKDYKDFLDKLVVDEERNDLIWEFMEPSLKAGKTLLVVTRRRAHARYWEARIRAAGYPSGLMLGQEATEFKRTVDGLRRGTIRAGVGTIQKGGTGHDIPRIDRAFILCPLANNRQLFEQVIGRIRRTHEGKTDAVCYYFWDTYCYPGSKNKLVRYYPGNVSVWVDKEFLAAS
jgi:superfamily II DNA or RNA helicase